MGSSGLGIVLLNKRYHYTFYQLLSVEIIEFMKMSTYEALFDKI